MSTNHNLFEEKEQTKRSRTEVPPLTSARQAKRARGPSIPMTKNNNPSIVKSGTRRGQVFTGGATHSPAVFIHGPADITSTCLRVSHNKPRSMVLKVHRNHKAY